MQPFLFPLGIFVIRSHIRSHIHSHIHHNIIIATIATANIGPTPHAATIPLRHMNRHHRHPKPRHLGHQHPHHVALTNRAQTPPPLPLHGGTHPGNPPRPPFHRPSHRSVRHAVRTHGQNATVPFSELVSVRHAPGEVDGMGGRRGGRTGEEGEHEDGDGGGDLEEAEEEGQAGEEAEVVASDGEAFPYHQGGHERLGVWCAVCGCGVCILYTMYFVRI
mmetsp:Transcript_17538/g.35803  ORF Transcript_17538/g.35803 Transcript_17538/m.35803 type:complete len:219 (-) Transcript_17538:189-845(-)